MINILELVANEKANGYNEANASAKVCQDLVLYALANSSLKRNVTIKGGVVMRSKTNNIRRATQDLDIDFIKYSISDQAIKLFVEKLNCVDGIKFACIGGLEELKQQDYNGKRLYIQISDTLGHIVKSKLDLGVHKKLEVKQEEYCFDIALNDDSVNLLINSSEQMIVEKLRSLLKFGAVSTRYKDIFDIYFLIFKIEHQKLLDCLNIYIFHDNSMREQSIDDIVKRLQFIFKDRFYLKKLLSSDKNWLDVDVQVITEELIHCFEDLVKD